MHSVYTDAQTERWGFEMRGQYLLSGVGGVFPQLKGNRLEEFYPIFSSMTSYSKMETSISTKHEGSSLLHLKCIKFTMVLHDFVFTVQAFTDLVVSLFDFWMCSRVPSQFTGKVCCSL